MPEDLENKTGNAQEQWHEAADPNDAANLAIDAQFAAESERKMSLWQGMKAYPRAVGWSVVISAATTMDGYDTGFLTSLFGLPAFRKQFGHYSDGDYVLDASWQSAVGNSSNIGIFLGVLVNGWLTEYLGHRRILMGCYVLITGLIFIPFFAPSLPVLLTGEILCGLVWGQFSVTGATYASEVCPLALRAYLTSYINITWIIGQLIAACVMRGVSGMASQWAYKIPFAVQWVWPVPLLIGVYFAPESPWWLVRKDRLDRAEHELKRLTSGVVDTRKTIAMMVHTNRLEQAAESGTTYLDCFKGVDLRRTEIACMAWGIQVFFGLPMNAYDTYFFERAGLATSDAFDLTVGDRLIAVTGTALSWVMLSYFGRRTIYMIGITINVCLLTCIGFASLSTTTGASWAQSVLLMCWPFFTSMTVGSVAFSVVSEVSSTRLRAKTIALARNTFNILNIIFGAFMPYLFNADEANIKGKAAFIFVFLGICCFFYVVFRLPEMKYRTYEELDILFMRKTKARDFKKTVVHAFQENIQKEAAGAIKG